jgi:C-methyltransferase
MMTETIGRPPAAEVERVYGLIGGVASTAAIGAAVELGLFDAFGAGPVTADALAARVGADADAVHRLLRALAAYGLVDLVGDRCYQQNAASHLLCSDSVGSAADVCRLMTWSQAMWRHLGAAVRAGTAAFPLVHGMHLYEYLASDAPGDAAIFDRAMSTNTELVIGRAVEQLDMTGVTTVADIGGGHGLLLREVLTRYPATRGVLFDVPPVLAAADPALVGDGGLADRVELVAGDFHQSVPVPADLYLAKQVLHNWPDDVAVRILRNIGANAPEGARIVVVEMLLDGAAPDVVRTTMDLLMLLFLGGKERTEHEFAELFERAGLDFAGVSPVADGLVALVEGRVPGGAA